MQHPTRTRALLVLVGLLGAACSNGDSNNDAAEVTTGNNSTVTPATLSPDDLIQGADVRFSEVHYHPFGDVAADEFIELVNAGDQPVQLQEWCITGVKFCFVDAVELAPGTFLVLYRGEYEGALNNKDDRLRLIDPLGQIREELTYEDGPPWPELADGAGQSLQRIDLFGDPNDPTSWIAAEPTPGAANQVAATALLGDVVVTEVNYHSADDNPAATFVELLNTTAAPIDLNGWCIEGLEFCFSTPTPVQAASTFVIQDTYDASRLSRSSDRLRLVDGGGIVQDVMSYGDSGSWPAYADGLGHSLQRLSPTLPGLAPGNWMSAEPNPGTYAPSSAGALLPTFDDLAFELLPEAGADLHITAVVADAEQVSLGYVIDFDEEVIVAAEISDGVVSATVPGQPAGTLMRFRLIGTGRGGEGTWPRQGDGADYEGTVVRSEPAEASVLPRLQLFMPDEVYEQASRATTLHGDEGFPVVFAFDGEVYDHATIRIKGNQARANLKKKWKVMLPPGHEWDAGGLLVSPVDEFDLLPAATDKSYSREVLTADLQAMSGGYAQQAFPVRVERNNLFFGLYMYGESLDGDWRDRYGFSDGTLVYKGEHFAQLDATDLRFSQDVFRQNYERYTLNYLDDNDQQLRDLITTLDTLAGDELAAFAYQHIDIPQVVEALATMRVAQHSEWQHKNYFLMYDPEDEKWRLFPIDFDLNFGRLFHSPCDARCDDVQILYWPNYPDHNRFLRVFLRNDVFRAMVERRTRTVADEFFAPGIVESRLAELFSTMEPDAALDVSVWGQYGESQSLQKAQTILLEQYVIPQRRRYFEREFLVPAQVGIPEIQITAQDVDENGLVVQAALFNPNAVAVDVSGRIFEEIGAQLPAGVVISAGATIYVVFERVPIGPQTTPVLVVLATRVEPV